MGSSHQLRIFLRRLSSLITCSLFSLITTEDSQTNQDCISHVNTLTSETNAGLETEGPQQPLLKSYDPKELGNESFTRDFKPEWYKRHPWLSYDTTTNKAHCYACQTFLAEKNPFFFDNWKKPERLAKHHKSEKHQRAMEMWMSIKANKKRNSSVISLLNEAHKQSVKENRMYLQVIIECLMYTAQQNIAQRGHEEVRTGLNERCDVNRGNFLELISFRCKDIPWLKSKLELQLQKHAQWTSSAIQNKLLQIIADLVKERIVNDVKSSGWYGIILDETSDITRIEQVSLCLSYCVDGIKKEAFVGFYATKSTEGEVLYQLVKDSISELNLELENIVGKAFDGAANMNGIYKGLSTRMKECSPYAIYVHCYGHLLNLALQDTMKEIEPLRNALGNIQSLYNFLEASPKRHALFSDVEDENEKYKQTLKSLSVTRWSCRWVAVKSVYDQIERIVKTLLELSSNKDSKTYTDSRALLVAICDMDFIIGLCLLRIILSNTHRLSQYLQRKDVDVISARKIANMTMETLCRCRSEDQFNIVWNMASLMGLKIKFLLSNTGFELREARVPRHRPSRRLEALVGESSKDHVEVTSESHHRVNTYYPSIDKVLSELELRFSGNDQDIIHALGDVCQNKDPKVESFALVAQFYGIDQEILQVEQKMFTSFRQEHGFPEGQKVAEVLQLMQENDLFDMLPEFAKVMVILAVIPATSCSAERSFSALRRLKTYLRNTMGQERINSIALINIEREYANAVMEKDMERIINIFASRKGRNSSFF